MPSPCEEPRPEPGDPIAFVHVMKCGGSSVREALRAAAAAIPADVDRRDVVELHGADLDWIAGLLRMDPWQVRDVVLCNALAGPSTRVVMGHVRFPGGIAPLARHVHFVTVLRDPIERFMSLHRYRTYGNRSLFRFDGTVEQFLEQRPDQARRNGAAYVELFRGGKGAHDRPVTSEDIDAAVHNLGRFTVVGMFDELGRFEQDLADVTGLTISIPHLNRTTAAPIAMDPGTRRVVEELCRPSYEVLERVRAERDR